MEKDAAAAEERPPRQNKAILCALMPPANIEIEFNEIQTALFRWSGDPRAISMPPLLPLGWMSAPLTSSELRQCKLSCVHAHPFHLAAYRRHGEALFLMVESGRAVRCLRESVAQGGKALGKDVGKNGVGDDCVNDETAPTLDRDGAPSELYRMIPSLDGFYIGTVPGSMEEITQVIHEPPKITMRACRLVCAQFLLERDPQWTMRMDIHSGVWIKFRS